MGREFVNLIGIWKEGFAQPLRVMTDLKAEDGFGNLFAKSEEQAKFSSSEKFVRHAKTDTQTARMLSALSAQ